MPASCIFCKIITGEIPSQKVYSDELVTAFRDIHPLAPCHILIVPNKHLASVNEVNAEDEVVIGRMFTAARKLAEQEGVHQAGYRLIINTGPNAGQEVQHLHLHLIGGQKMRYPMG
jgi:histidine triad (HIT) family protein